MIDGWQSSSDSTVEDAIIKFNKFGISNFLLTSIIKDGTLSGPDIVTLNSINTDRKSKIIASGGISNLFSLNRKTAKICVNFTLVLQVRSSGTHASIKLKIVKPMIKCQTRKFGLPKNKYFKNLSLLPHPWSSNESETQWKNAVQKKFAFRAILFLSVIFWMTKLSNITFAVVAMVFDSIKPSKSQQIESKSLAFKMASFANQGWIAFIHTKRWYFIEKELFWVHLLMLNIFDHQELEPDKISRLDHSSYNLKFRTASEKFRTLIEHL